MPDLEFEFFFLLGHAFLFAIFSINTLTKKYSVLGLKIILRQHFLLILSTKSTPIAKNEKQTYMREDFLHYLWRMKRFHLKSLQTTEGEPLQIVHFGQHNHHAGPDFLNARVKIGDTLWAGNIELHRNASEWIRHKHQKDAAYDNVVLHVVLEEDQPIFRSNGARIPCLELRERIPPKIAKTYQKLIHNEHWIPCQHQFCTISETTKNLWLDRLLVERLEQKTIHIAERLRRNKNAWEETFYQILAYNFGLKVNAQPFELLAQSTPLKIFAKPQKQPFPNRSYFIWSSWIIGRSV